jgi:hypothetical protein
MAACQRCKKSGILVRVDTHGVCRSCRKAMSDDAARRAHSIAEATERVERGERLELRLERCETIIENAGVLRSYGEFGVWVEGVDPSQILSRFRETKRQLVHGALADIVEGASGRAAGATNPSTRRGALEKGLEKVESLKTWLDDPREALRYENDLASRIARIGDTP